MLGAGWNQWEKTHSLDETIHLIKCSHWLRVVLRAYTRPLTPLFFFCLSKDGGQRRHECAIHLWRHLIGYVRLASLGRPRCVAVFFSRTNVGNYLHTFVLGKKNATRRGRPREAKRTHPMTIVPVSKAPNHWFVKYWNVVCILLYIPARLLVDNYSCLYTGLWIG